MLSILFWKVFFWVLKLTNSYFGFTKVEKLSFSFQKCFFCIFFIFLTFFNLQRFFYSPQFLNFFFRTSISSSIRRFLERPETRSRREPTRLDVGSQECRFEIGRKVFGVWKRSRFFRSHLNRRNEVRMRKVFVGVRLNDQRCRRRACSIKINKINDL